MTIDEAIKYLERMKGDIATHWGFMGGDSIRLGIEALKFYKELKRTQGIKIAFTLPGETEEVKYE